MKKLNVRQIRGAKDLVLDAVDAGVSATEKVHLAIAQKPYAILAKIEVIAVPVNQIERIQMSITGGVYRAIRAVNKTTGFFATQLIDRVDAHQRK